MWQTYPEYCKDMKRLGVEPLPEEIWQREYAPKNEPYREPLIISPKNRAHPMSATLENHIADVGKKVKKNDQSDLLSVLENRLKEKKKKLPKPKAVKPIKIKALKVPKPPKVSKPKVNLKAMTPEER